MFLRWGWLAGCPLLGQYRPSRKQGRAKQSRDGPQYHETCPSSLKHRHRMQAQTQALTKWRNQGSKATCTPWVTIALLSGPHGSRSEALGTPWGHDRLLSGPHGVPIASYRDPLGHPTKSPGLCYRHPCCRNKHAIVTRKPPISQLQADALANHPGSGNGHGGALPLIHPHAGGHKQGRNGSKHTKT